MKLKEIRTKYKHLNPNYQPASRRDLVDYDYLEQLSEEELEFLNKFTAENISANFKDIPSSKFVSDDLKKKVFKENYRRNADVMAQARSKKGLDEINPSSVTYDNNILDTLCDLLDKWYYHPDKFKKNDK
jgi:hypothetical protein